MAEYLISLFPAYTSYPQQRFLFYIIHYQYPADWKRAICVITPKKANNLI
jgi:hypothetical protein